MRRAPVLQGSWPADEVPESESLPWRCQRSQERLGGSGEPTPGFHERVARGPLHMDQPLALIHQVAGARRLCGIAGAAGRGPAAFSLPPQSRASTLEALALIEVSQPALPPFSRRGRRYRAKPPIATRVC